MRPFSSGTEYGMWTEFNCQRCKHGWREERDWGKTCRCEIELQLVSAYLGDGEIPDDIAARANFPPTLENKGRCGEFEIDRFEERGQ